MANDKDLNNLHLKREEYYKQIINKMDVKLSIEKQHELNTIDLSLLEEIAKAIPYIEKIFAKPKMFIKNEEEVLNIAKMKKITTDSVKDLAKHGNYVQDYDEETTYVLPEKMLNVFKEDTFNTYENRFIYSLVNLLINILNLLEPKIEQLKDKNFELFNYKASTSIEETKVDFNFELKSTKKFVSKKNQEIFDTFDFCKKYVKSWKQTEFYKNLVAEKIIGISGTVRRTNVILKNPNFQIAVKLWDYLHKYELDSENSGRERSVEIDDIDMIYRRRLENNFLSNYYIMKIYTSTTEEEKEFYKKSITEIDFILFKELDKYLRQKGYLENFDGNVTDIESEHYDVVKTKKVNDATEIENKMKELTKSYLNKVNNYNFEIRDDNNEESF